MIIKFLVSILIIISCLGCATAGSISKSYNAINWDDGINISEAKVIAKHTVLTRLIGVAPFIRTIGPRIIDDKDTKKFPDYWFVEFSELIPSEIRFKYLVVIDKKSGVVKLDISYLKGKGETLLDVLQKYSASLNNP